MMYSLGDRVRVSLTAEDGLPLVRYGFVRSVAEATGPVVVMFDGEIGGEEIAIDQLEPVTVTSLDLRLEGAGLLDDPELRRGLAPLWQAEAEDAGLDVDGMVHLNGDGAEPGGLWTLAHFTSGGERYALRARSIHTNGSVVRVHAVMFTDG
jgi:hypothetical protein